MESASNSLSDKDVVLALKILIRQHQRDSFDLRPKGRLRWIEFIDDLFRINFPKNKIPWRLVNTRVKIGDDWYESEEEQSFDSYFSIKEYWIQKHPHLDDSFFSSPHFSIILDTNESFRQNIQAVLKQHVKKLLEEKLERNHSDVLFTSQLPILLDHLQRKVNIQGVSNLFLEEHILRSEFLDVHGMSQSEFIRIRLPEMLFALQFARTIRINSIDLLPTGDGEYLTQASIDILGNRMITFQSVYQAYQMNPPVRGQIYISKPHYSLDEKSAIFRIVDTVTREEGVLKLSPVHLKILKTFIELWEKDPCGRYDRGLVKSHFQAKYPRESENCISDHASRILKNNKDLVVKNLLVIKGNHSNENGFWEFRILDTTTPPNQSPSTRK